MEIQWEQRGNYPDDLIARIEASVNLRVERLRGRIFWWCVYVNKEAYDCWSNGEPGKNLEDAKAKCIEQYKKVKANGDTLEKES